MKSRNSSGCRAAQSRTGDRAACRPKIGQYDLAKITQWHLGRVAARHRRSDPDLSSDSSSPALEQYRQERAKLAKLDRIDREASLVDREKSLTMWRAMLVVLRRAAVRIGKAHGDEARSIVDEGLDEADRIAQQFAD